MIPYPDMPVDEEVKDVENDVKLLDDKGIDNLLNNQVAESQSEINS